VQKLGKSVFLKSFENEKQNELLQTISLSDCKVFSKIEEGGVVHKMAFGIREGRMRDHLLKAGDKNDKRRWVSILRFYSSRIASK